MNTAAGTSRPDALARALSTSVLAALCLAAPGPVAAQTITYVGQERRVEAHLYEAFVPRDDTFPTVEVDERRSQDAPDFADFDAGVRAESTDPRYGGGRSRISQRSSLRADGVFASGDWGGNTATYKGYYEFRTLVAATFDVAGAPARYDLSYVIAFPDPLAGRRETDLVLRRVDGAGATLFDVEPVYDDEDPRWDTVSAGGLTGELAPGRYEFRFFDRINNDPGTSGGYEVNLRLSPVPEPGAVALLTVFAGAGVLRRSRRA